VGGSVSERSIVRIDVEILHVSMLGNSSDEKPQRNCNKNSLPKCAINSVPHLIVEHVDLLKTLNVILLAWGVGKCPNSEVMHVRHVGPRVAELRTNSQEFILELGLLQVLGGLNELRSSLHSTLHITKFVHY